MDKFNLVEVLSSYISCKKRIDNNLDEIQRLRSCMEKVTVTYKDAPGWERETSDQAVILTDIDKLSQYIKEDSSRLVDNIIKVQRIIDSLDDEKEREIMQLIYINGYTRSEVEEKIGYGRMQIYRMHKKALKKILRRWNAE